MTNLAPRVLCVEDTPDHVALIRAALEPLPARVEVAATGDAAVNALLAAENGPDPYHLVILDIRVPRAAGEPHDDLLGLRLLTELNPAYNLFPPELPVVVFTNHDGYERYNLCLRHGASHFLPKLDADSDRVMYDVLAETCRDLLYPARGGLDPLRDWLTANLDHLVGQYAGRAVALAPIAPVGSGPADYHVCAVGATEYEVGRRILADPALRWRLPRVLTVPYREDVQ